MAKEFEIREGRVNLVMEQAEPAAPAPITGVSASPTAIFRLFTAFCAMVSLETCEKLYHELESIIGGK